MSNYANEWGTDSLYMFNYLGWGLTAYCEDVYLCIVKGIYLCYRQFGGTATVNSSIRGGGVVRILVMELRLKGSRQLPSFEETPTDGC